MPTRLILGLMSGTSVDSIDSTLVQIRGHASSHLTAKTLYHHSTPWPPELRRRLLAIMAPAQTTTQELCQLHALVSHHFAQAALTTLKHAGIPISKITALSSHGQTICHLPPNPRPHQSRDRKGAVDAKLSIQYSALSTPSTLQLGDPSIIATLTGIPTIANFRPADIALGGQGAPLVPWTDDILLSHPTQTRAVQNLGGIANVTYLPPTATKPRPPVLAFDTGPANMLIDALVSLATNGRHAYDHNGQLAAAGSLDPNLFRQLQSHPYFDRTPPKSTGREDFGLPFAKKIFTTYQRHHTLTPKSAALKNLIHTATYLTAWSIVDAYLQFLPTLPDEVILCGGGADNPTLVAMLQAQLTAASQTPIRLSRIDDHGIPNKAKEAASFALLAAATLDRTPANLPSVTGATRPTVLGVIAYPH